MKVYVDWSNIKEDDDFYSQIFPQLKAPTWHGRNLNALGDSLVTGDINKIEPPFCVINLNVDSLSESVQDFFNVVNEIYEEATNNGRKIRVFNEKET